jgi:hypothetical protein
MDGGPRRHGNGRLPGGSTPELAAKTRGDTRLHTVSPSSIPILFARNISLFNALAEVEKCLFNSDFLRALPARAREAERQPGNEGRLCGQRIGQSETPRFRP